MKAILQINSCGLTWDLLFNFPHLTVMRFKIFLTCRPFDLRADLRPNNSPKIGVHNLLPMDLYNTAVIE